MELQEVLKGRSKRLWLQISTTTSRFMLICDSGIMVVNEKERTHAEVKRWWSQLSVLEVVW